VADQPGDLLERLVIGAVAVTERAIAAAGADLTFVQWRVLLIVGEHAEGATVGEIAARIGAQPSPASRLIGRLKQRGVVQTAREDADRRVTRVRLTAGGHDLRRRVLDHRRADIEQVVGSMALTATEAGVIARLVRWFEPFA
jgi:DNA-binding MarR family transcriptional regulator